MPRDQENRRQKYLKIRAVIEDYTGQPLSGGFCLDVGCGNGLITAHLSDHFRETVDIDTDRSNIRDAIDYASFPRLWFYEADAMALPFEDGLADLIICNQVYEHATDPQRLVDEIYRVLAPDGICYFSAGNRLQVMEAHYGLPFLSWLPPRMADLYLKLAHRGSRYEVRHLYLWQLRRLLRRFEIRDYTIRIIEDPRGFYATDLIDPDSLVYKGIQAIAGYVYPLIPTYVWVLMKVTSNELRVTRLEP